VRVICVPLLDVRDLDTPASSGTESVDAKVTVSVQTWKDMQKRIGTYGECERCACVSEKD
jgi:hypothetical protein